MEGGGTWLAQSVQHMTRSQRCKFETHVGCRDNLKLIKYIFTKYEGIVDRVTEKYA